jgi:hypothetical protein
LDKAFEDLAWQILEPLLRCQTREETLFTLFAVDNDAVMVPILQVFRFRGKADLFRNREVIIPHIGFDQVAFDFCDEFGALIKFKCGNGSCDLRWFGLCLCLCLCLTLGL